MTLAICHSSVFVHVRSISELLELQKLRRSGAGIDLTKLNKGVSKKKPKKVVVNDEGDTEAKARKVVRTNNFTKQTNALDVDKHMCVRWPQVCLSRFDIHPG